MEEVKTPKKYSDSQLLDWLQNNGFMAPGLINDDGDNGGLWAVSMTGIQNMPMGEGPQDISTSFFVEAHEWKPTVREAIIAAIEEDEEVK
jgi:hypothetical protein